MRMIVEHPRIIIKDSKCAIAQISYPMGKGAWHESYESTPFELERLTEEQAKALLRGLMARIDFAIPRSNLLNPESGFGEGILTAGR